MNKENIGKIGLIIWIGTIALEVLIGVICIILGITAKTCTKIMMGYLVLVLVIYYAIDTIYVKRLLKSVDAILPMIYDDPDRYLEEIENLIGDAKSSLLKSVYCINRCAAYCTKEDYIKAKEELQERRPEKVVPHMNRVIYNLNLAIVSMHLGEDEEAIKIWQTHGQKFVKFKDTDNIGPAVASVYIFALIKEEQYDEAAKELADAKQKWTRPRDLKGFEFLESIIVGREWM